MPLPVRLPVGVISIYGVPSLNGLLPDNKNMMFGVIDAVYLNIPCSLSVGNVVMIDKTKAEMITYDNYNYYLVEETKIGLVENAPIVP